MGEPRGSPVAFGRSASLTQPPFLRLAAWGQNILSKGDSMKNTTSVVPFQFQSHEVRTVVQGSDIWFVAKDVCSVLGVSDYHQACSKLDDDERGRYSVPTPSGMQDMLAISESGLYALMLRCRDAMTPGSVPHRMRKWVTSEVLPTIRKTGGYVMQSVAVKYKEASAVVRAVMSISKMLGTSPPMAKAIAVEDARRATGIDCSHLLPVGAVEEVPVGVRKLAELAGIPERKLSGLLMEKDLAIKDENGHVCLTEKAKTLKAGSMEPFKSRFSNHSGYQCKWFPSVVIPLVKEAN